MTQSQLMSYYESGEWVKMIKSKLAEVEDDEVEQQEVQGGHCEEGECRTSFTREEVPLFEKFR